MRRRSTVQMVVIAAGVLVTAQAGLGRAQSTPGSSAVSADVTKIERAWEKAMNAKDSATVDGILAPGWTSLNPDATLESRTHFLGAVKNGDLATVKLDDIAVSVFGGTAVAHGKAHDKDGKYAYSDVFVQEGGKWRAVFSQLALLPPPAPPKK